MSASCIRAQMPAAPRTVTVAPAGNVAFGASIGVPMMVSASEYFYNYGDYTPPGLGLRFGLAGSARMRIGGIDRANPAFAIIAESRYATIWHSSTPAGPSQATTSARFGMLSFGLGFEQAFGAGRAQPFFGLTLDVNAIEPGSVRTTYLDNTGYHTTSGNLAGDAWQLRFGVTPRMGIRAAINRALAIDVTAAYRIANIVNRADYTPKNYLLDEHGREALLTDASLSLGFLWTMPTVGLAKKK